MATVQELKDQIDVEITDVTATNGVTQINVGNRLKQIMDVLKPYKEITFDMSISGSTVTPTYIINDFASETITLSIPSTGLLRVEVTSSVLQAGKVYLATQTMNNAGTPYFLVPDYGLLPVFFDISMKRYDNDMSSTPSVSNQRVEIRIYN